MCRSLVNPYYDLAYLSLVEDRREKENVVNKRVYGRNLAEIRRRVYNPLTLQPLTQKALAESTGLTLRLVQKIEQGEKSWIEADILVDLADALCLNTQERIEFFALSFEVNQNDLVRTSPSLPQILQAEFARLAHIQLPATLYDSFYTIIAVNHMGLELYGLSNRDLSEFYLSCFGVNLLGLIFNLRSLFENCLDYHWRQIAKIHIHQFRSMSLPYRYTACFQETFTELSKNDDFMLCWMEKQFQEEDFSTQIVPFNHPQFGVMHYETSMNRINTIHGNMYFAVHYPFNKETFDTFTTIREHVGLGYKHLANWPCIMFYSEK